MLKAGTGTQHIFLTVSRDITVSVFTIATAGTEEHGAATLLSGKSWPAGVTGGRPHTHPAAPEEPLGPEGTLEEQSEVWRAACAQSRENECPRHLPFGSWLSSRRWLKKKPQLRR